MTIKFFAALMLALSLLSGCGKQTNQLGEKLTPGTTQFKVTAGKAPTSYTVNGFENATITMKRGTTYTFQVHALGHPFYIFFEPGGNIANAYTNGVSGNGVEVGILTITVPHTAPSTLYYGSSREPQMFGTLNIEN